MQCAQHDVWMTPFGVVWIDYSCPFRGPPMNSVPGTPCSDSECVIAIPGVDLASTVVDIGNCSGEEIDKFAKFGLATSSGTKVKAPLLNDCLANIECKVKDRSMVAKYNMWILSPVAAWVNPDLKEKRTFHHKGDGTFVVDGETINLQERMVMWKEFQD